MQYQKLFIGVASRFFKLFKSWELRKIGNVRIISKLRGGGAGHCLVSSLPQQILETTVKNQAKADIIAYSSLVYFCLIYLIFAKYFFQCCRRKNFEKFSFRNFLSCAPDKMFIVFVFHETVTAVKNVLLCSCLTTRNVEKRTSIYFNRQLQLKIN